MTALSAGVADVAPSATPEPNVPRGRGIDGGITEQIHALEDAPSAAPPLLHGLAQRLQDETRMHVYVADNPLTAVVMGTGMILEKPEFYRETLTSMQRKSTIR